MQWIGGRVGLLLFLAGLVAAVAAAILRLHLWFTVRSYPAEWARSARARPALDPGRADVVSSSPSLAGAGRAVIVDVHASAAMPCSSAPRWRVFLSSAIIEPATTERRLSDQ